MTDTGKTQSINLIKSFVDNILDRNIDRLKDFSFLNLLTTCTEKDTNIIIGNKYKQKFGDFNEIHYKSPEYSDIEDYNRRHSEYEDCDNMNLARAIYYLLYYDKLNDFQYDSIKWIKYSREFVDIKYRGETINTFNTLINDHMTNDGYFFYEKFFDFDNALIEEITQFRFKVFSIGNFMLLPNNSVGLKTLNTYKGLCLGDYSYRFFNHILNKDNEYINKLLTKNEFWYSSFKNDSDIEKFIKDNYLQDYFDGNKLNNDFNFAPYYAHWFFDKTQDIEEKEIYADYIRNYIKVVTEKIDNRADRMIKALKENYSELNKLSKTPV